MNIPGTITAGDTVSWRDGATSDNLGAVIDSTWTLTWTFSGQVSLTVVSATYSTGWQTDLTAAQTTSLYAPDTPVYWQATAAKAGRTVTVGSGVISISPNLATVGAGYDGRSKNQRYLAILEAALENRMTGGAVVEYTIGSRRLRYESIEALEQMRRYYAAKVVKEGRNQSIANGLGDPMNTFVRFG